MATAPRREDRHGGDRDQEEYRRREPARQEPAPARKPQQLNEYFIDGEGIHREVLQMEICKYLGAEATCRPGEYNGRKGYRVKALRPFTPEMIVDLKTASADWSSENRNRGTRGWQEVPYLESDTRRRQDVPSSSAELSYQSPSSAYASTSSGYPGSEVSQAYPSTSMYTTGPGYPSTTYTTAPGPSSGTSAYPLMGTDPSRQNYPSEYTYAPNRDTYGQPQGGGYQPYPSQSAFRGEQSGPREQQLPPGYSYPTQRAPALPPQGRGGPMDPNRGDYDYSMGMSTQSQGPYGGDPYRGQPSPYSNPGPSRPHGSGPPPPPSGYYGRQ